MHPTRRHQSRASPPAATTRVDEMALDNGRQVAAHREQRRGSALRDTVRGEWRRSFKSSRKITKIYDRRHDFPGQPGDRAAGMGSQDQAFLHVGADPRENRGAAADGDLLQRRADGDRSALTR